MQWLRRADSRVYSAAALAKRTPDWQKYHSSYHTSSTELADLATKAKPKLLILYHQLMWSSTEPQLLEEIRRGYRGQLFRARFGIFISSRYNLAINKARY